MSKDHWENVYTSKNADEVSWFQPKSQTSLNIIKQHSLDSSEAIIDVGGGASTLVDELVPHCKDITVLDCSGAALKISRERLKEQAKQITWLEANILEVDLPYHHYDIWHDRAVFHFLTDEADRQRYVDKVSNAVKPGGLVVIATFAEDGPTKCSGLPVTRYSASELHGEFGARFDLIGSEKEPHVTPWGSIQQFVYCFCTKA